jgi:hypothetical protein
MNTAEARVVLDEHLDAWRRRSHADLAALVGAGCCRHADVVGPSGTRYQVDVEVVWDGHPGGTIRVLAAIDDGGWRAFVPISESFLVEP